MKLNFTTKHGDLVISYPEGSVDRKSKVESCYSLLKIKDIFLSLITRDKGSHELPKVG